MNVIYRLLPVFVCLFYFNFIAYCKELNVSFIDNKNKSIVSIEFNNTLQLYGLKLAKDNTGENLLSPSYKSKNSRYSYFSFLDRNFKNQVIDAIKTNTVTKSTDTSVSYKINKFNVISNLPKAKAFVSVIFNDLIEVQCSIIKGNYGLHVQWPSQKKDGKWEKLFVIKDKNLKYAVDNEILRIYRMKAGKETNDKFNKE